MKKVADLVIKLKPLQAGIDPVRDRKPVAYSPFVKVGESTIIKYKGRAGREYIAITCRECKRAWNVSMNMKILGIGYTCPGCKRN